MARPLLGHLDPRFLEELDRLQDDLRVVFESSAALTFPVSGTGSAAMETAVATLCRPGRKVLVLSCGVFGERIAAMVRRYGADLTLESFPFGSPVDPEVARRRMREVSPDVVAVVQAETSTGVRSDVDAIAALSKEFGANLIVDAVTSLGGLPVHADAWDAAIVYSGSQKCLGAPPGLGPITVRDGLVQSQGEARSWYFDLGLISQYLGSERLYHHTAPISMIFALAEALRDLREEGLPGRFARHRKAGTALRAGLEVLGLESRVAKADLLPSLTVVAPPEGLDEAELRKELLFSEGIEIAGGLGPWKGTAWRIGTMGESARLQPVLRTVASIGRVLARHGRAVAIPEAGAQAAKAWEETE
jgi:alanine-glyoxylate transaminase/serine-glyoxylate transaminase/serine-pyruvate transaminase